MGRPSGALESHPESSRQPPPATTCTLLGPSQAPSQLRGFAHALLSAGNALPYRFSYPKVRAQRPLLWVRALSSLSGCSLLLVCLMGAPWRQGWSSCLPVSVRPSQSLPWRMLLEGPLDMGTVEWSNSTSLFPCDAPRCLLGSGPTEASTSIWVASAASMEKLHASAAEALSEVTGVMAWRGWSRTAACQPPSLRCTFPSHC